MEYELMDVSPPILFTLYVCVFLFLFFFFFLRYWSLSSGLTPWATLSDLFGDVFFWQGLQNCLPRLALNYDPPDLCFLSSQIYRHEPPMPSYFCIFWMFYK
jgi:hypothetical protein